MLFYTVPPFPFPTKHEHHKSKIMLFIPATLKRYYLKKIGKKVKSARLINSPKPVSIIYLNFIQSSVSPNIRLLEEHQGRGFSRKMNILILL